MESQNFCSGKDKEGEDTDSCNGDRITIDPTIEGGDRVFTDDGVTSTGRYEQHKATEKATKDAHDVRATYLEETNKGKKEYRDQQGTFGRKERIPLINQKDRHEGTSFVRHLTEEDLKMEKLQQIREKYWQEYGHMVDENIVILVNDYVKSKLKKERSPLKKTHLLECALLALTKGPANLKELIKRLDTAIEGSDDKIKFRFTDVTSTFTETLRRIVKADPNKNWLRKYLVVDGNGNLHTSRYEFPPPMMQIAAQAPAKMKEAWMVKLPKGSVPFTESELLRELPILSSMIITDPSHHGSVKKELPYDIRVRKSANEGNRCKLVTELKDAWMAVEDITKLQLFVGIMASSDCIVGLNTTWLDLISRFMSKHKNRRTYKEVGSGEISASKNKLRAGHLAICALVIKEGKMSNNAEIGLIPDAASIPFSDLRKMSNAKSPKYIAEGLTILAEICRKNENIDRYVNPEKYANELKDDPTEDSLPIEQTDEKPLDGIQREGVHTISADSELLEGIDVVEVQDEEGPTAEVDPMSKLADAVSKIADHGVEFNLNINFGRFEKKSDTGINDLLSAVNHNNEGLDIAIQKMGLVMLAIEDLVETIKK